MRPRVIAHRGASYVAPENTLTAFYAAREIGADGFETDVQLTKDGKMVIHHNYTIDANSDGSGRISEMTLEELKKFDFGSWKGKEFAGERIVTLEECLEVAKAFKVVNVELKAPMDRSIPYVELVAKAIKDAGLTDRIIVSAFDHTLLRDIKKILPKLRVGALTLPPMKGNQIFEMAEKILPPDIPLNQISLSELNLPSAEMIDLNALQIPGKDMKAVVMEQIQSISAIYPGASFRKIQTLLGKQQDLAEYVAELDFKLDYLHCEYHSCLNDTTLVKRVHALGIGVNPWTPDKEEELQALVNLGVDGIITNRPDVLLDLLDK